MVRATLGGVVFDGTEADATYTIGDDGLRGWFGGVSSRVDRTVRPQSHGEFTSRGLLSGRVITLEGMVRTKQDGAAQETAVNVLSGLLADGETDRLTVESAAGVLWADVQRLDEPDTRILLYGSTAAYQVRFLAADPRRYADGAWQQTGPAVRSGGLVWPAVWPLVWPVSGSSGRVTLPNPGRAPSPAVFRLLGPFDSALITCVESGARVGFNRPVPAGSVVEVSGRRAVIDGQSDVSRWLQFREWTDVPGGESRTFQFDPVGGAAAFMQGKVDPAWW